MLPPRAVLFPEPETAEAGDGPGAEFVDSCSLAVQTVHQIERTVLVGIEESERDERGLALLVPGAVP